MISNRFKSVYENEDLTCSNMTQQNRWENKFFRQQLISASVAGLPPVHIGPPLRHHPGFEYL